MTKGSSCSTRDCRKALLDAAERLFVERGYQEVSTRDIAEAAKVNLGLIQYYFGSKANLFVETVHRMMQSGPCARAGLIIDEHTDCPVGCADKLCEFIYVYLEYLLRPEGPQPCRLMFREINSETARDPELFEALVSAVSEDFTKPLQGTLVELLGRLDRSASKENLERNACSILGQCTYYALHRPFIERLWGVDITASPTFEEIGAHVASFSLRALGSPAEVIDRATTKVFSRKRDSS